MNDPKILETETTNNDAVESEQPRLVVEVPSEIKAGMPPIRGGNDCLVCTCDGGGCCSACP